MKTRKITRASILIAVIFICFTSPRLVNNVSNRQVYASAAHVVTTAPFPFHYKPDYDSGWTPISKAEVKTFPHNLGGDPNDYIVDLQYKDKTSGFGVNQEDFGSEEYIDFFQSGIYIEKGAYWFALTDKDIAVKRQGNDVTAEEVRIRIWITHTPDFDSNWKAVPPNTFLQAIDHNLGGSTHDYIVDMQFRDLAVSGLGVHNYGYGMINAYVDKFAKQPASWGGLWRNLSNASIFVARGSIDSTADNFRIRIWKNKIPDYDSGWFELETQITAHKMHNLKGDPDDYVVDLQFRDTGDKGVNQQYYGSNSYTSPPDGTPLDRRGASWSNLNNTHISVWREQDDGSAPEARVRIWVSKDYDEDIYLPIILTKQ